MNIVLIHPYLYSSVPVLYLNEPIGLMSLATVAKEKFGNDIQISILDLYEMGWNRTVKVGDNYNIGICDPEEIRRLVDVKKPDIIGISCNFTAYTKAVYDITALMKKEFPDALLAIGGAHASMDVEGVLAACPVDIVVIGEGEQTLCDIINARLCNKPLKTVAGLAIREKNDIYYTGERDLIPDLSRLPIVDRSLINQDNYSLINRKMYFLSRGKKVASIMTSRGCPYRCTFCSTRRVWKRVFRPVPAASVVKEMEALKNRYGIDEFIINDDLFFGSKKRVHAILDMIRENGWKIYLNIASGTTVWMMDEPLLTKLKQAGLYRVTLPIETGNEKSLSYINKNIDFDHVRSVVKTANRLGMWTYGNFIIGFPYEKREEIEETVSFAASLGLDNASILIAKPYAGSVMYEHFLKENLLTFEGQYTMGEADHGTVHMTRDELQRIRNKAQLKIYLSVIRHYLTPSFFISFLLPKLRYKEDFGYFIRYIRATILSQLIKPVMVRLSAMFVR